jgi:hypothetical protein
LSQPRQHQHELKYFLQARALQSSCLEKIF